MSEKKRLQELDDAITSAKSRLDTYENNRRGKVVNPARISIELLSGVVVGCLLGYYLDVWLDTSPVFFLICFFFGVAGSGLNIYKIARQQQDSADDE